MPKGSTTRATRHDNIVSEPQCTGHSRITEYFTTATKNTYSSNLCKYIKYRFHVGKCRYLFLINLIFIDIVYLFVVFKATFLHTFDYSNALPTTISLVEFQRY